MSRIIPGTVLTPIVRLAAVVGLASALAACASIDIPAHLRPLPKDAMMLLGKKGMNTQAPIFVRIYKEESELEVWKLRDDGRYYHFKTYPICNWSGDVGPKLRQGDRQSPEGFYQIKREQMKPDSKFHLAFNLGYPNPFDKAHRRTGDALMVHGKCASAGCYAMTDALMEEIYALAREAFIGGQDAIPVHAFPFRMTDANMARHAKSEWYPFWRNLKEGYDHFELTRQVPEIAICNRRYVVNVTMPNGIVPAKLDPAGACPVFHRPAPSPFTPRPGEQIATPVVAPGPKMRTAETFAPETPRSGLTRAPAQPTSWWRSQLSRILPGLNQ
jgi:murein L,D-transpeptidase YafK